MRPAMLSSTTALDEVPLFQTSFNGEEFSGSSPLPVQMPQTGPHVCSHDAHPSEHVREPLVLSSL
jgi:hypothetical protein